MHEDDAVGHITSGTLSPCLKKGIAMGYVKPPYHQLGTEVEVVIRDDRHAARVTSAPFIKK